MNWELFQGIIDFYVEKGDFDEALRFTKEWNVVDQDTKVRDVAWLLDYEGGIYYQEMNLQGEGDEIRDRN